MASLQERAAQACGRGCVRDVNGGGRGCAIRFSLAQAICHGLGSLDAFAFFALAVIPAKLGPILLLLQPVIPAQVGIQVDACGQWPRVWYMEKGFCALRSRVTFFAGTKKVTKESAWKQRSVASLFLFASDRYRTARRFQVSARSSRAD